ncbi:hypothetical protein BDF19DRAFT_410064 [Syncephalis fuscata]|nr:hypothetical protein BDF19DRAFT_410064 [Syncephalis fuscata]
MLQAVGFSSSLTARTGCTAAILTPNRWIRVAAVTYTTRKNKPPAKLTTLQHDGAATIARERLEAAYNPFRLTLQTENVLKNMASPLPSEEEKQHKFIKKTRFPNSRICLDALRKREKLFKSVDDKLKLAESIIAALKEKNQHQMSLTKLFLALVNDKQLQENTALKSLTNRPGAFVKWLTANPQNDLFLVNGAMKNGDTGETAAIDPASISITWSGKTLDNSKKTAMLYALDKINWTEDELLYQPTIQITAKAARQQQKLAPQTISNLNKEIAETMSVSGTNYCIIHHNNSAEFRQIDLTLKQVLATGNNRLGSKTCYEKQNIYLKRPLRHLGKWDG